MSFCAYDFIEPQRLFKDQKLVLGTRPLGDKTPLPNRFGANLFQTPLPQKSKLSKLTIVEAAQQEKDGGDEPPGSIQRPSSLRTHIKHPKSFQTPVNSGHHWDVSDGDIVVPEVETQQEEAEPEDDLDEIEYCPPNTLGKFPISMNTYWVTLNSRQISHTNHHSTLNCQITSKLENHCAVWRFQFHTMILRVCYLNPRFFRRRFKLGHGI